MKGFLQAIRLLAVAALLVAACGESVSPADSDQPAVEFEAGPLGAVVVPPGEQIQIRSLNTISGDNAFLGIPNQRGVEMAIEDYGPVAGREVSMGTPLDDLCSPDGGQSGAQATVADPSVVGLIGTTCSSAATAASPLISDAGMVMIAPSNTSPALTSDLAGNPSPSHHPGYYRTAHNDLFQGKAVALFVRDHLGFDTAAAIHDGDPYTQGLAEAFKDAFEELGGVVTAFTAVNKGDTDMIAVLTEVAAGRPQTLFFPVFMPEGAFIVQQVEGVTGLEDVTLIVSAALLVDNFMELPESQGVYISGPDLRFGDNRNSVTGRSAAELLDAYEDAYGEAPSGGYLAHSYDATTMLLRAIDRVAVDIDGTLHIDRGRVRDELTRTSMDGIIGPIDCDQFGDCGTQRLTVLYNTDPRNIEAGKNNVVFEYAP